MTLSLKGRQRGDKGRRPRKRVCRAESTGKGGLALVRQQMGAVCTSGAQSAREFRAQAHDSARQASAPGRRGPGAALGEGAAQGERRR